MLTKTGKLFCVGLMTISVYFSGANAILGNESLTQLGKMTEAEIAQQMPSLPGWTVEGQILSRTFMFKNFVEAIAFVNRLVEPSETSGHHPDLSISYNRVTVSLTTHDAGGLTEKDFDLARIISQLY